MKAKDIVIGIAVVALLTATILVVKNNRDAKLQESLKGTPTIEQKVEEKFGGLQVPADVEKTELKDVSGGDGFGIATRTEVLADLPSPANGAYQVWLEKDGKKVLLGNMRVAKGGYLLEYSSAKFPGYDKVIVTLNSSNILEGSF
ncbi:MAG: hypothetical protein AAB622_00545 [Patescibacteria group bacterium]